MFPSQWNTVVSNSQQHCTVSCVKLRISYPTETAGHAYKERFISLLEFVQEPVVDFFFHESSAKDHILNTKMSVCVYVSIKTIKGCHHVQR